MITNHLTIRKLKLCAYVHASVYVCTCVCGGVVVWVHTHRYMCVGGVGVGQGEREVGGGRLEDVVALFLICHNATVAHQWCLACVYRKVCSDR